MKVIVTVKLNDGYNTVVERTVERTLPTPPTLEYSDPEYKVPRPKLLWADAQGELEQAISDVENEVTSEFTRARRDDVRMVELRIRRKIAAGELGAKELEAAGIDPVTFGLTPSPSDEMVKEVVDRHMDETRS